MGQNANNFQLFYQAIEIHFKYLLLAMPLRRRKRYKDSERGLRMRKGAAEK